MYQKNEKEESKSKGCCYVRGREKVEGKLVEYGFNEVLSYLLGELDNDCNEEIVKV